MRELKEVSTHELELEISRRKAAKARNKKENEEAILEITENFSPELRRAIETLADDWCYDDEIISIANQIKLFIDQYGYRGYFYFPFEGSASVTYLDNMSDMNGRMKHDLFEMAIHENDLGDLDLHKHNNYTGTVTLNNLNNDLYFIWNLHVDNYVDIEATVTATFSFVSKG